MAPRPSPLYFLCTHSGTQLLWDFKSINLSVNSNLLSIYYGSGIFPGGWQTVWCWDSNSIWKIYYSNCHQWDYSRLMEIFYLQHLVEGDNGQKRWERQKIAVDPTDILFCFVNILCHLHILSVIHIIIFLGNIPVL